MSGISQATGLLAAREGLWNAIQEATASHGRDLDRYYTTPDEVTSAKWVGLTDMTVDPDLTNIGPRRSFDEAIRIGVSLGAWAPGRGEAAGRAAFEAAFAILSEIQTYITQRDVTLGDAVLWCLPGQMSNDAVGSDDGNGYVVEIVTEFVCAHKVRPI